MVKFENLVYFKGRKAEPITNYKVHSDDCVEFECKSGKYLYMTPQHILFDVSHEENHGCNFYRYSPESDNYIQAPYIDMVILPS